VRERDFAGPRDRAAANETGVRNGVVRRAKRRHAHESRTGRQQRSNAIDSRHLHCLVFAHRWQYGWHGPGKERLPAAGWPAHDQVVSARCRNFECSLCVFLSHHVRKVRGGRIVGHIFGRRYRNRTIDRHRAQQVSGEARETLNGEHIDAPDERRLGGILLWHERALHATVPRQANHWKYAARGPNVSG